MLKWILGGVLLLVVVLAGTCWYGYTKATQGGDTAEVAIAASPERVFASLINPDSMVLWMSPGTTVSPRGRDLVVGDTLRYAGSIDGKLDARQEMAWVVREVVPPTRIVMDMVDDSTGHAVLTRRDEIISRNDSAVIMSRFASPMMDSMRTTVHDSSRVASGVMGGVQKLMVGALRMLSESELQRLKARVETP